MSTAELPKHGEVWTKEFCGCGICSMGWSLGAGTHTIDTTTSFDWGTPHQIECGCLHPGPSRFDAVSPPRERRRWWQVWR